MRRPLLLLLLVALAAPALRAQLSKEEERQKAADAEVKRQELSEIEQSMVHALRLKNGTFFQRVFGEDFLGTDPAGELLNKEQYIKAVTHTPGSYSSFMATDVRIRMFEEMAVITCLWTARGTQEGKPFSRQYRVTQILIYGQRGWQVVGAQETKLAGS